jgi:hypothetical protein
VNERVICASCTFLCNFVRDAQEAQVTCAMPVGTGLGGAPGRSVVEINSA